MGRWISRLGGLFDRARRDRELADELNAHLDAHIQDNIDRGLTPDAARREALLRLGGTDMAREAYRDQRGIPAVDACQRELRQAFGRLRRSPAFTAAAALSLGLAIAANVSIFAVVERVVINPLPYPASDRLVMLDFAMPARNIPAGFVSITPRQYFHYADNARTVQALTVYRADERTLTGSGIPERIRVVRTTPSLLSVLRVPPMIGGWLPEGPRRGAPAEVVLSYGLWTRVFGADAGIIGRSITLNAVPTIVAGVMPQSFAFPDARVDAWVNDLFPVSDTDGYSYAAVARLRDGVRLEQARAEIDQLSRSLAPAAPREGYDALNSTALSLQDFTVGPVSTALWILLASAALVLLIACANIANLFLVRSEARQREVGVRRALGAGTGGIAGYFFAESALLSLAGCAMGLVAAWYGVRALVAFGPLTLPRLHEVRIAPIHIVFSLGLSAVAALVFGLLPLARVRESAVPLHGTARGATANRATHRTRQLLMAGQVALALVLLIASGLLFRSFVRLRAVDPGFNPESTLTFQLGLPRTEYTNHARMASVHQQILDRLSALPGVTVASVVNCVPLSGRGYCNGAPLFVEGESVANRDGGGRPIVATRPVGPSFFDAMGMRLLAGRALSRADADTNNFVAVVDQALAQSAFPGQNPIGRRIRLAPHIQLQLWFTIVGVVGTTPTLSLTEPRPAPKMYLPIFATADVWPRVDVMQYVVRTSVPPLGLAASARDAVRSVDADLALSQVRTLQDHLDAAAAPRAFTMILILIAAATALLLGVVGIYGVTSYTVSQRTSEIGVRIALGAQPGRVMRMVIAQGGTVALAGIAAGLVTSLAGSRVISSLLYGISPRDPQVFVFTTLTLFVVALVACWIPARRAASVDPVTALRTQ